MIEPVREYRSSRHQNCRRPSRRCSIVFLFAGRFAAIFPITLPKARKGKYVLSIIGEEGGSALTPLLEQSDSLGFQRFIIERAERSVCCPFRQQMEKRPVKRSGTSTNKRSEPLVAIGIGQRLKRLRMAPYNKSAFIRTESAFRRSLY